MEKAVKFAMGLAICVATAGVTLLAILVEIVLLLPRALVALGSRLTKRGR